MKVSRPENELSASLYFFYWWSAKPDAANSKFAFRKNTDTDMHVLDRVQLSQPAPCRACPTSDLRFIQYRKYIRFKTAFLISNFQSNSLIPPSSVALFAQSLNSTLLVSALKEDLILNVGIFFNFNSFFSLCSGCGERHRDVFHVRTPCKWQPGTMW